MFRPLHKTNIDYIRPVDPVLGQRCLIIAHHDRDRTSV